MIFDAGDAASSFLVPLEARMVPLEKKRTPPGLKQVDLRSVSLIQFAKALNLINPNPDLFDLPFSKDTPQPLRDVSQRDFRD